MEKKSKKTRENKEIVVFNEKFHKEKRVIGPIAVLKPNKRYFKKKTYYYATVANEKDFYQKQMIVFPCLVVSTNNDFLRDLKSDSFALLKV